MRRPILLLTCAVALIAAGCGDSDKKSESTAPAASGAPAVGASTGSGLLANVKPSTGPSKLDLDLSVKIDGVPAAAGAAGALLTQPINLKVSGVSDSAAKSSDVDIALDLGALALNAKLLSDGTKQWIQYDDAWYVLDTKSLAGAAGGITGGTTTAPTVDTDGIRSALSDPSKFFKDSKKEGDEKVGDIETEHISGTLDVAAALQGVKQLGGSTSSAISPEQAKQLTDAFNDPKVDVWVGKDDRVVHRLAFQLDGDFTGVADAQGLKGLTVDLDATMLPADSPKITPPANAKSSQELLAAVLGGFGPALGLGALPTATG
jgi:uncharacterized protein involved in high-affinity Fe2+ transport